MLMARGLGLFAVAWQHHQLLWDLSLISYCESSDVMATAVVQILSLGNQTDLIFIRAAPDEFRAVQEV